MENPILPMFDMPPEPITALSKSGFAERVGVVPGRVTQWIAMGLPVQSDRRINVEAGEAWLLANIDPNRRKAKLAGEEPTPVNSKGEKQIAEARLVQLKVGKLADELLDRRTALAAIEARARAERDAWLGWVHRSAPELARELGGELHTATNILDRLVRDQLDHLSRHAIVELDNDQPDP